MQVQQAPLTKPFHSRIFFLLLLTTLAIGARAAELEPDVTLEGFPFSSAASVAMTADGLDLYACGTNNPSREPTPGLVWLRRDPVTGNLDFQRNYLSDTEKAGVRAAALSRDDSYLYVLLGKQVVRYLRALGGSLSDPIAIDLPATLNPESLFTTPDGSQLVVLGRLSGSPNQALFYRLDANGSLSLEQTLAGNISTRSLFSLADDLLVSGRVLIRRTAGLWATENIPALDAYPFASISLVSPNQRYLYSRAATGTFPSTLFWIITFEQVGGSWTEVGRSEVSSDFEREETARAVHPQSGDIYIASYNTNGGDAARIDHYRSLEGGRIFSPRIQLYDANREFGGKAAKHSLTFTGDGRQLYANFGGEPMAMLEVDSFSGALSFAPGAAGPYSHFERPFAIEPGAGNDVYLITPNAIVQSRWEDGAATLRSSLDLDTWSAPGPFGTFRDLELTPDGGAGVVSNIYRMAMVERNPATGVLRFLDETSVSPPGNAGELEMSPDGRYVYLASSQRINVYFLRRDVPKLVPVQEFPLEVRRIRLSPDGKEAVAWTSSGSLSYLLRDIESGLLTLSTGPVRTQVVDAFFAGNGQLALWQRGLSSNSPGTLELLRRNGESWAPILTSQLPIDGKSRQVFDEKAHFFFRLHDGKLEQYAATPQQGAFTRLTQLSGEALGSVATTGSVLNQVEESAMALLPGDEQVLLANAYNGNVRRFRRGCGSLAAGPCLGNGRFRVEIVWQTSTLAGPGLPLEIGSDDSQLFSFFDTSNWEVLVKVLDGCSLNGRFWVYAAASTDLAYDLIVTDTWTGKRSIYRNAAGVPAPAITDANAFSTCAAESPGWNPPELIRAPLTERPNELRLASGYQARVRWTTTAGLEGQGNGLETQPQQASGLFYFFDRNNWELLVKVLDGCALNGHRWVFTAATTDVGYTLEVEETATTRRKTYSNPAGQPARATTDIQAFPCN